ncbi:hypothetical protein GCU72_06985 [Vibrio sp. B1Z05]|nr:hypothetical protein [Vibrio sp. B1Z05]
MFLIMLPVPLQAAPNPHWYPSFISSQYHAWTETDFRQSSQWFDCAENETPLFCSDEVVIHRTPMYGTVAFDGQQKPILKLNSEFSLVYFNELQLGLRSDGFQLIKIEIKGHMFDITQQLTTQSATEVDKQVQQFIQGYRATDPRVLYWQSLDQQYSVLWQSDKTAIQLIYTQGDTQFDAH